MDFFDVSIKTFFFILSYALPDKYVFVVLNPAETPSNYYSFFWFSWVSLVAKEDT